MKKHIQNKSTKSAKDKKISRAYRELGFPQTIDAAEEGIDTTKLDRDIPEEFREPVPEEMETSRPNMVNWSEAKDRGEDLAEERDPFMQQSERDTQIPPELIQERTYRLYQQRGGNPGDNLADWFEAERQLRKEIAVRKKTEF
jgi:hypothetical protein